MNATALVTMPKKVDTKKLRAAREAKGWSVDDAVFHARTAGWKISRNTIVNLETGASGGTVETLSILAELYGRKRVDDLLTDA